MCKYIFVVLVAAVVAHLIPKSSHYIFQGVALANSTVTWTPQHNFHFEGMVFVHAVGNGTIRYDNVVARVDGHLFFHTHGSLPMLHYEGEEPLKVIAHLNT